jgi:hypothetical protein
MKSDVPYRERQVAHQKKSRTLLRAEVLREYGHACACCGESAQEFLALDHIFNDGGEHRREIKRAGSRTYAWLKRNGFPKDRFQLLCHNCNMAKAFYGQCPHQSNRAA